MHDRDDVYVEKKEKKLPSIAVERVVVVVEVVVEHSSTFPDADGTQQPGPRPR